MVGVGIDGEFWVSRTVKTILLLQKDPKHVSPLVELEEEERDLLTKALKVVGDLEKVDQLNVS